MTYLSVGRAASTAAHDESVAVHLKGKRARLSPEQARWLAERLDEELALLDGGGVQSVDAVDAPEVSDDERDAREQHPPEEMGTPEYRVGEKIPDEASDESEDVDAPGLENLREIRGLGERRVELLAEAGFEDLADIHDAAVGAIAIDGISESSATEISRFAAERLSESSEDADESESGNEDTDDVDRDETVEDGETVLDHERIATAMDSIGIADSVATGDVVHAIDVHNKPFRVASQLDIPRADADDLIERLDLQDALDSKDDLAQQRFGGEGGTA